MLGVRNAHLSSMIYLPPLNADSIAIVKEGQAGISFAIMCKIGYVFLSSFHYNNISKDSSGCAYLEQCKYSFNLAYPAFGPDVAEISSPLTSVLSKN